MAVSPIQVAQAVRNGLSAVCATCTRYWEARDRGLPEPQCLAKNGCGSPIRGDTFSEYNGPLRDFSKWCFVCAQPAHAGIRVRGHTRLMGVCQEHTRLLQTLKPLHNEEIPTQSELLGDTPLISEPRSLARAIYEVESYFAKKEGREL